jgi:hypothetical protein
MEQSNVGVPTSKDCLAEATQQLQEIFQENQSILARDFRSHQSLFQVAKIARLAKQMTSSVGARTFMGNLVLETLLFVEMNLEKWETIFLRST